MDCLIKIQTVTNILSFNPLVSYSIQMPSTRISLKLLFFSQDLTHSHTMTPLETLRNKHFENTEGKGEIARNEQFLLSPQCFLPVSIAFCHFRQI